MAAAAAYAYGEDATDPVELRRPFSFSPASARPVISAADTLALVYRSTEMLKSEVRRADEIETRSRELLARAEQELMDYRDRLQAAEKRAADAEAQIRELNADMARIHDLLAEGLQDAESLAEDREAAA